MAQKYGPCPGNESFVKFAGAKRDLVEKATKLVQETILNSEFCDAMTM